MSNYMVGRDCSAVIYLEEPIATAGKEREYLNEVAQSGETWTHSYSGSTTSDSDKRLLMGAFITINCQDPGTVTGTISVKFTARYFVSISEGRWIEMTKTISEYSTKPFGAIGFSATDFPADALSARSSMTISVEVVNNSSQYVRFAYLTKGPLLLLRGGSSLSGFDFGSSLGDDEKTITFGMCRDYGSLKAKDESRKILGLLSNPAAYGLDQAVSHYSMRVEFLISGLVYGVFEVDKLDYDDGSHVLSVSLKSPIDELDRILIEPLYYTNEMSLAEFLTETVAYAKDMGHGAMLGMFDFSSISSTSIGATACLGRVRLTPLIEETQLDMGQLMESIAQAAAINILVNPTISTSMKYRFFMVPWFGNEARISLYGSDSCQSLTPTDLLGNPTFTPLKDNYIDKITYESHALSLASEETEVTETFPITTLHPGSAKDDMKSYWCGLSGIDTSASLSDHDSWFGDRLVSEGRGPKPSELAYNTAKDKVHTSYRNLRYMMAKASTRSLLYRFRFNEDFNEVSSTTVNAKWQDVVDEAAYMTGDIPSDLESTESERLDKLLSKQTNFLPAQRYNSQIEMAYERDSVSDGVFWQHGNAMCAGGKYTIPHIFSNFQDLYDLRVLLPKETRFVGGSTIILTIRANYWYTMIFGGWDGETLESSRWAQRYVPGAYRPNDVSLSYASVPNCYTFNSFTDGMGEMADYMCAQYASDQKQVQTYLVNCTLVQSGNYYVPFDGDGNQLRFFEAALWTRHFLESNSSAATSTSFSHWYEKTTSVYSGYYRYNRVACPPRVFDNQDPTVGSTSQGHGSETGVFGVGRYYHTGDGDDAQGKPLTISVQSLAISDVDRGRHAISVPVKLPSSSAAVTKVRSNEAQNIFGADTGYNAYCSYFNPPYLYSYLYTTGIPVSGGTFIQRNMSFDKPIYDTNDIDNKNSPNYFPSNPVYGYIIKDIVATVTYTPYTIENLGEVIRQYNEFGKSNYNLTTNGLMVDQGEYKATIWDGSSYVDLVPWVVSSLADYFESGRYVATVKSRMKSGRTAYYDRLPIVGDSMSSLKVIRDGAQTELADVASWRVKSAEFVYENGDSYCVLGLMER